MRTTSYWIAKEPTLWTRINKRSRCSKIRSTSSSYKESKLYRQSDLSTNLRYYYHLKDKNKLILQTITKSGLLSLSKSLGHSLDKVNSVQILISGGAVGVVNANSQILSHFSVFDSLNGGVFQVLSPLVKSLVIIEFSSVHESSGPCENRSNGVG